MQKNSSLIIIGGMPFDMFGRALGPYRVRTACEKAGYSASIIDTQWVAKPDELFEMLDYSVGHDTLAIGVSCTWNDETNFQMASIHPQMLTFLKTRYPHIKIVLGVSSVARLDKALVDVCDWVAAGFSEESIGDLLDFMSGENFNLKYHKKRINGKDVGFINGNTDYILRDMDKLETVFHPHDDFKSNQPLTIETCRGCIFSCAYCTYPFLGKKNYDYIRSAESLAAEFKRNYDLFGTTRYMIADDTFNDSLEKIARVKEATQIAKLPKFEFVSYIRPELLHIKPAMIPALIDLGLKGAFFGIESFNSASRKAMGRSTPIEHVLGAIENLKAAGDVRTHGSLVIGLPEDSREDILQWGEYLTSDKNKHFDALGGGTLVLSKRSLSEQITTTSSLQSHENRSLIEINPEKYGYQIIGENGTKAVWKNKHMTSIEAEEITRELFGKLRPFQSVGGWYLGGAWYHGLTDEELSAPKIRPMNLHIKGLASGRERLDRLLANIRRENA